MDVTFSTTEISQREHGEIDAIIQTITGLHEQWTQPTRVDVRQRLSGGRSGSQVLAVVLHRERHLAPKVIKIGLWNEIKKEFDAWDLYLKDTSKHFIGIEAASTTLRLEKNQAEPFAALLYDFAPRYDGQPEHPIQHFEQQAREAVLQGGDALAEAASTLRRLFAGMQNDLYDKALPSLDEITLHETWNHLLGCDAVIAIDQIDSSGHSLYTSTPVPAGEQENIFWPRDIQEAAADAYREISRGDRVRCRVQDMIWRRNRLFAKTDNDLRLEIICDQGSLSLNTLQPLVGQSTSWAIYSRLEALRAPLRLKHFLHHLGNEFHLSEGEKELSGPDGARVPHPFQLLPRILQQDRRSRVRSLIHGDLNPRNILLIGTSPYLIDYTYTRENQPICMDFCRLEGCLLRDVVSSELSWAQLVRLQRLLAISCRLGEHMAQKFQTELEQEHPTLANAFQILWIIRQAAQRAYPHQERHQWERDYMEHLFLFAHLTLKWDQPEECSSTKMQATAAIMGVATECLLDDLSLYRFWPDEHLQRDGLLILQFLQEEPVEARRELAHIAYVFNPSSQGPLFEAFEQARTAYLRFHFRSGAHLVMNKKLREDHDLYISLQAYIALTGHFQDAPSSDSTRFFSSDSPGLPFEKVLFSFENESERLESALFATGARFLLRDSKRLSQHQQGEALALIAKQPAVVLLGDAGTGKSTVAREVEYRLADLVSRSQIEESSPHDSGALFVTRFPLYRRASDLLSQLSQEQEQEEQMPYVIAHSLHRSEEYVPAVKNTPPSHLVEELTMGAFYIIIDALNEVPEPDKSQVSTWLLTLRKTFPLTHILICHRAYTYEPMMFPFPMITLQKLEEKQAERYIRDYLRIKQIPNHEELAQSLIIHLLESPDELAIRDLARTPLFLWMLVEYYQQNNDIPKSRSELFQTFSRWYLEQRYHDRYNDRVPTHYSFDQKVSVLEVLGETMVESKETSRSEKACFSLPFSSDIQDHVPAILKEMIEAQFLLQETGPENTNHLRFLHQSFQEYFAASHILPKLRQNPEAIRERLRLYQSTWRDVFILLLGFASLDYETVTAILKDALKADPRTLADLLRVAEQPDPAIMSHFIEIQKQSVYSHQVGEVAHQQAIEILIHTGQPCAWELLWEVMTAPTAPTSARVAAITALNKYKTDHQTHHPEIEKQLLPRLIRIFDEQAPIEVQRLAINAIDLYGLKELGSYLGDLIQEPEHDWTLKRAAFSVCSNLGIPLAAKKRAAFLDACRKRLFVLEQELYATGVEETVKELQEERRDILCHLVAPENLRLLLHRRFKLDLQNEVKDLINSVCSQLTETSSTAYQHDPDPTLRQVWTILLEAAEGDPGDERREHWFNLILQSPDDLVALAAGHRLVPWCDRLPPDTLSKGLRPDLSSERLSILAALIESCNEEALTDPLEHFLRSLMQTIPPYIDPEGFVNLLGVVAYFDPPRARQICTIANYTFYIRDQDKTSSSQKLAFPWCQISRYLNLHNEDYDALFVDEDENAVRAAVFALSLKTNFLLSGSSNSYRVDLSKEAMQQFSQLDYINEDSYWLMFYVRAATLIEAVDVLPYLLHIHPSPDMMKDRQGYSTGKYGINQNCAFADIMRAIGFLARCLVDQGQKNKAQPAVKWLHQQYSALSPDTSRSLVIGLATALGYLGEWQALLTHLGPEEPWMHDAVINVFDHWFTAPLNPLKEDDQREEAARWVVQRLRDTPDLPAHVRSTLLEIKGRLQKQLNYDLDLTYGDDYL